MPLQPGQAAEVERVVTRDLAADVLGNPGVTVLATPCVVTLLENAAHAVMVPHVPPGGATVGTRVDMRHLAATPIGMRVRAKAVLLETDGRRCLFEVEAWDEVEKIAEGRHERFVITCRGKVIEKRPAKDGDRREASEVDVELWAENQKGEKVVTGRATVTLPSRG